MDGLELALLTGAVAASGIVVLHAALVPARPSVSVQVARLDGVRRSTRRTVLSAAEAAASVAPDRGLFGLQAAFGRMMATLADRLEVLAAERGWRLRRTRADLAVLGRRTGSSSPPRSSPGSCCCSSPRSAGCRCARSGSRSPEASRCRSRW